jgi:predicted dehydrogenase
MPRLGAPVRIALIGAGSMGSYHARVITQSPHAELACIVDPNQEAGRLLAERFDSRWVPKLDDLGPFDAVVVASPTGHHVTWALRALEADKPVLVEKPVSERYEDVEALVAEASRRDVPLMSGLLERFNPALMTLADIVDQPVHITTVRHSPYVDRIATGVAFDLLIHDVDLILRLAGTTPTETKAQFAYVHPKSEPGSEDVAEVSMRFDSGLVSSLSASRVSQRKIRTLEVAELERLVEVDLVRQDITVYRHVGADFLDGAHTGYRQQTVIDIPTIEYRKEPLAAQLDHFVELIQGEADPVAERASLLPPHQVVANAIRSVRPEQPV